MEYWGWSNSIACLDTADPGSIPSMAYGPQAHSESFLSAELCRSKPHLGTSSVTPQTKINPHRNWKIVRSLLYNLLRQQEIVIWWYCFSSGNDLLTFDYLWIKEFVILISFRMWALPQSTGHRCCKYPCFASYQGNLQGGTASSAVKCFLCCCCFNYIMRSF